MLRQLARANTPTEVVSLKMGRTATAIRAKAHTARRNFTQANQSLALLPQGGGRQLESRWARRATISTVALIRRFPMAKKRKRKYSRGAGEEVRCEMHRYKRGKAKAGGPAKAAK
jgi:hypothetical protein